MYDDSIVKVVNPATDKVEYRGKAEDCPYNGEPMQWDARRECFVVKNPDNVKDVRHIYIIQK